MDFDKSISGQLKQYSTTSDINKLVDKKVAKEWIRIAFKTIVRK